MVPAAETGGERKKPGRKEIFLFLAIAAILTLLAASGISYKAEQALADVWYQSSRALEGNIVLVGIDQKALDVMGPYQQWDRTIMADTVEALNQSEDCRPSVIGIDVLYTGETEPEADGRLAAAAAKYNNVVCACAAVFGNRLTENEDGSYYMDRFSVIDFDEPYEELKHAAGLGHINAMMDQDGILRHHLLKLRLPDGNMVSSLALLTAEKYAESTGHSFLQLPPTDSKGFWYVPYSGATGHFAPVISIADILSGEIDPQFFNKKIVLIGPYAAGLQDSYLTAIDHASPMYGVEYQANALQALLEGNLKKEAGNGWQLGALFVAGFVGAAVFWRRRTVISTAIWLLVSCGYLALCRWLYSLSKEVARILEGKIVATSLGDTVKLKGKKAGFEVLTLDKINE